jgi:hypothetical protein
MKVPRSLGTVGLVLALLAILIVIVFSSTHWPYNEEIAACQAAYRRSTTAQDSAIVDQQRPVTDRVQASVALDCGTLRRTGKLR